MTGIEYSGKLLEGHIMRGEDMGGECEEMGGTHTVNSTTMRGRGPQQRVPRPKGRLGEAGIFEACCMLCLGEIRSSTGLVKKGGKFAILGWDGSEADNMFSRIWK